MFLGQAYSPKFTAVSTQSRMKSLLSASTGVASDTDTFYTNTMLAMALLIEKAKGHKSSWAAYIRLLPQAPSAGMLI